MDLHSIVAEFIDELLSARGSYGVYEIGEMETAGETAALLRFTLRVADGFAADGWQPSEDGMTALERERKRLTEILEGSVPDRSAAEERAVLRGRAQRARAEAQEVRRDSGELHKQVADLRREIAQMRQALESRAVIEQAKGVAMERYAMPPDSAWAWLVRMSQQHNEKLREVAQRLVESVGSNS